MDQSQDPEKGIANVANAVSPKSNGLTHAGEPNEHVEKARKGGFFSNGWWRHFIAVLALSSIMLANTNRQAYNQALSRMIKRSSAAEQKATESTAAGDSSATLQPLDASEEMGEMVDSLLDLATVGPATADTASTTAGTSEQPPTQTEQEDNNHFDWSDSQISTLQSAFSYGYVPAMVFGGRISELYGAKWVIFLSGFGSAVVTLATPFLARFSFALLVGSRVLMGVCQTGVSPALYALLVRWLAPDEASFYLPLIKVGVMLGFASGSMINSYFSWMMTFQLVGVIGLIWSVPWMFLASSDPSEHKSISEHELDFILTNRTFKAPPKQEKRQSDDEKQNKSRANSAPWLGIIKNPVVLAFVFTKLTVKMSTDLQSIQMPFYLANVHHISDDLNGKLNAINFAIQAVFTGMVAYGAKVFVSTRPFGIKKTGARRLFQCTSSFSTAAAFFMLALSGESQMMAIGGLYMVSIASMFSSGGEAILPIDITDQYAASIMALANCFANLSGIITPETVKFLLQGERENGDHWRRVWLVFGGFMALGGLVFLLFAKAKILDFGDEPEEEDEVDEEKKEKKKQNATHEQKMVAMIPMNTITEKGVA